MSTQLFMHCLPNNRNLPAAIARCRATRPKATRLSETQVSVRSRSGRDWYTVTLAVPRPDILLAACDCPAGQNDRLCYHAVAAAVVPSTVGNEFVNRIPACPTPAPACIPTGAGKQKGRAA